MGLMMFAAGTWNSAENVRHVREKADRMAEGFFAQIPTSSLRLWSLFHGESQPKQLDCV
jgi:hypothetical protein